jgi:hypothetical protein
VTTRDELDMVYMIRLASYLAAAATAARKRKNGRVQLDPALAERASDILLAYVNRKVEDHAKALGV